MHMVGLQLVVLQLKQARDHEKPTTGRSATHAAAPAGIRFADVSAHPISKHPSRTLPHSTFRCVRVGGGEWLGVHVVAGRAAWGLVPPTLCMIQLGGTLGGRGGCVRDGCLLMGRAETSANRMPAGAAARVADLPVVGFS